MQKIWTVALFLIATLSVRGAVITFFCGETASNVGCISDESVSNPLYPLALTFSVPSKPEVIGYSITLQNNSAFSETGDLLHPDQSVSDRLSVIVSSFNPKVINVSWCSDPESGPFTDLALCPLSLTSHSTALEDAAVEAHGIILLSSIFDGQNELRFIEQSDVEATDTPEASTWLLLAIGLAGIAMGRTPACFLVKRGTLHSVKNLASLLNQLMVPRSSYAPSAVPQFPSSDRSEVNH